MDSKPHKIHIYFFPVIALWPPDPNSRQGQAICRTWCESNNNSNTLQWCRWPDDSKNHVKKEDIEKAVTPLMDGEEAKEIRSRARAVEEMAKKAVDKGGSSYSDLCAHCYTY